MTDSNDKIDKAEAEAATVLCELHALEESVASKYARRWKRAGYFRKIWLRREIRKAILKEARKRPWGEGMRRNWYADSFMDYIVEKYGKPDAD